MIIFGGTAHASPRLRGTPATSSCDYGGCDGDDGGGTRAAGDADDGGDIKPLLVSAGLPPALRDAEADRGEIADIADIDATIFVPSFSSVCFEAPVCLSVCLVRSN